VWKHIWKNCHGRWCWVSSCRVLWKPQWIELAKK
jgi:hypothetical protein